MLDYKFKDTGLLQQALTHRSADSCNNDRLEYLGDAILGCVIAEALFLKFPSAAVGELSRLRAFLVKQETLARLAGEADLSRHLKLGGSELKSGVWHRDSILADALEALIGAIYLDSDFADCRDCILNIYAELLASISPDTLPKDPKTTLQEYMQARQLPLPVYSVINESGRPHDRVFTVQCAIEGMDESVVAEGTSRRNAEQSAAGLVLDKIHRGDTHLE